MDGADLMRQSPYEMALVYRRSLQYGIPVTAGVLLHLTLLVGDVDADMGWAMWYWCMIRVLLVAPRIVLWRAMLAQSAHAAAQPTPMHAAKALTVAGKSFPATWNARLQCCYLFWLITTTVWLHMNKWGWLPNAFVPEGSKFPDELRYHCYICWSSIITQRVGAALYFCRLLHDETLDRGEGNLLAAYTKVRPPAPTDGSQECVMCLDGLWHDRCTTPLRELRCGHAFHRTCIDQWLRRRRDETRCPTCQHLVWPVGSLPKDDRAPVAEVSDVFDS